MRILIGQPSQENNIVQLSNVMKNNPTIDIILFPEGYLANEDSLEEACKVSNKYNTAIITGFKKNEKNYAVIINRFGNIILKRPKTPISEDLYKPSVVEYNGLNIGYLLCREILKGLEGLEDSISIVAHPIGVGMFSDKQFDEWINLAREIAVKRNTMIIGTSHADGVLKGYDISIPISYCIDENGEDIFISKSDVRNRILDLETKELIIQDYNIM